MSYTNPDALVSTQWVEEHLDDPKVRIVDASWHLPPTGRNGYAEYREAHIPGAVFFDLDAHSAPGTNLPHMLPAPEAFAFAAGTLGIGDEHRVVVYDADGLFSAPRIWWMFRIFGHDNVAVMAGGFRAWQEEGRPVTHEIPSPERAIYNAAFRPEMVRSLAQMQANVESGGELVLDARAAARFAGSEPEFRPGVRAGHIPGSSNLPYAEIVDPETGGFRDADTLRAAFDRVGADGSRPVTTSCGSGVTACILGLGMHLIGRDGWAVYDGSWTEWGSHPDTEVETGSK